MIHKSVQISKSNEAHWFSWTILIEQTSATKYSNRTVMISVRIMKIQIIKVLLYQVTAFLSKISPHLHFSSQQLSKHNQIQTCLQSYHTNSASLIFCLADFLTALNATRWGSRHAFSSISAATMHVSLCTIFFIHHCVDVDSFVLDSVLTNVRNCKLITEVFLDFRVANLNKIPSIPYMWLDLWK